MPTTYTSIAANKRKSFLLVAFFVLFVVALGWFLDYLTDSGMFFLLFAGVFAALMSIVGYYQGGAIALRLAGARPLAADENPYVYRLVENLAITAGLPMPKVYWIEEDALNAFATGRDPKHASIAVTRGLVERLENEELEGVLAHELSHVGNYDVRFMTLVGVLVGLVAILADMFVRTSFLRGRSSRNDRGGGGILLLIGLVFIILSPVIAQLIQFAVSRKREFLADASGALLTRYPEGLANALEKIGAAAQPMQHISKATAHLFISNPFGGAARGLGRLFSTHPPIEERIAALRQMAGGRSEVSTT